MNTRPTPIERAFDLARSGTCASVAEIRSKLKSEGLADSQITGPSLLKQLRLLVAAARPDEGEGEEA